MWEERSAIRRRRRTPCWSVRRSAGRSVSWLVVVPWLLLVGEGSGRTAAPAEIVEKAKKPRHGLSWQGLSKGLERVRAKRLPAVVWYDGEAAPAVVPREEGGEAPRAADKPFFDEFVENRRFRRELGRFVLIRLRGADLGKPYPRPKPPVIPDKRRPRAKRPGPAPAVVGARKPPKPPPVAREILGVFEGQPTLLLLDFRETVVRRYERGGGPPPDGDPEREEVRNGLRRVARENAFHVAVARKVERILKASEEQFRRGKVREAVILVRDLDKPREKARFDRVLRERVEKVIKEYRDRADKGMNKGDELLEVAKKSPVKEGEKFFEALIIYDRVARDYPFKNVITRVQEKKGVILTYVRLIGAPLPGGFRGGGGARVR
ncbi:MAG: hypothetical protein O7J95_05515 [Planctomycetota bacterium]|nr:hypothetical protein [Planctomycetota bacterium]